MKCIPKQILEKLCVIDDELKAIYFSQDWLFKTS